MEVVGPSLGSYDLAHGIAPTGSSDSHWGRFYGATDGLEERVPGGKYGKMARKSIFHDFSL